MSADPFGLSALTGLLQNALAPRAPSDLERMVTAMVASRLAQKPVQTTAAAPVLKTEDLQSIVNRKLDDLTADIDQHITVAVEKAKAVAAVPTTADIEAMVERVFKKMVQARVTTLMGVTPPPAPLPPDTGQIEAGPSKAAALEQHTMSDWITEMSGHFTVLTGIVNEQNPMRDTYNASAKEYNTARDADAPDDQVSALKDVVKKTSADMLDTARQIRERVDIIIAMSNDAKNRGWWVPGASGVKDQFDTMRAAVPKSVKMLIPAGNSGYRKGVDTYYP